MHYDNQFKRGDFISGLQKQVMEKTQSLPIQHSVKKTSKRIGIVEGEEMCAPDYDIDEYNGEIAKMFRVV